MMANPSRIRAITDSRPNTDEKYSLILAQLLRLDYIPRSYVPSPEIMTYVEDEMWRCEDRKLTDYAFVSRRKRVRGIGSGRSRPIS